MLDEAAEASKEREEQGSSDDGSFHESNQTSSSEDNSDKSNIPTDEGIERPNEPFDLILAYFGNLVKYKSMVKFEETQAAKRKFVFYHHYAMYLLGN